MQIRFPFCTKLPERLYKNTDSIYTYHYNMDCILKFLFCPETYSILFPNAERLIILKIAMIGHKSIPSRAGGVEVVVDILATRMTALGHDVTVYNRDHKSRPSEKEYRGIHICRVPAIPLRGLSAVTGSFFAAVHALFCHYDCIHFHAEGPAFMSFLPRLFNIRTVVTIHGLDWKRSKWGGFASWYLKLSEKIAAACAHEIIVLSRETQQYFLDTYHRDTVYIPNGIEHPLQLPDHSKLNALGLHPDEYILYLGRIVPEKGLHYLIRAFQQTNTNKKLVIAGSPSDTEKYYAKLREMVGNDDRIKFIGFVQGTVLQTLFANCYLYCLPSELEGMPISLLEAMSFGCCCLTSDIAECREVLGSFSYQFQSGNTGDLQALLQRMCDHPELVQECRQRMKTYIAVHPDWDAVVEQTLQLYYSTGNQSS